MICALHGFLGMPSDWDATADYLRARLPSALWERLAPFTAVDLFADKQLTSGDSLPTVASRLNGAVASAVGERLNLLIGYSLGGRVALHMLSDDPRLWNAAVIVSASPGLSSEAERADRVRQDDSWANRFESEPWESLMAAWNGQPVFGGRPGPERSESSYDRRKLAAALRAWSSGRQEDFSDRLATVGMPMLWCVGADDIKYAHIADLPMRRNLIPWFAPGCGHRVPWECPEAFHERLTEFIERIGR